MLTIKPNELEAIAIASSKEETRYYLNGVCIETYADGTCGLIATDGHRLHSINTQDSPVSSFILDTNDIKKAVAMAKTEEKSHKGFEVVIRMTLENEVNLTIELAIKDKNAIGKIGAQFTTKPIDGSFPDWRRVLPSQSEPMADSDLSFNCNYMADFGKAEKIITGYKTQQVQAISNGRANPILMKFPSCPSFTGVLMPMRA